MRSRTSTESNIWSDVFIRDWDFGQQELDFKLVATDGNSIRRIPWAIILTESNIWSDSIFVCDWDLGQSEIGITLYALDQITSSIPQHRRAKEMDWTGLIPYQGNNQCNWIRCVLSLGRLRNQQFRPEGHLILTARPLESLAPVPYNDNLTIEYR
jgi:hypothetical protein